MRPSILSPSEKHHCGGCGKTFAWRRLPGVRGRPPFYCSNKCGTRVRKSKNPKPQKPPRTAIQRRCRFCEKPFARVGKRGPRPMYCSAECRMAFDLERDRKRKKGAPCKQCGRPVPDSRRPHHTCSSRCKAAMVAESARRKRAAGVSPFAGGDFLICRGCSKEFVRKKGDNVGVYC